MPSSWATASVAASIAPSVDPGTGGDHDHAALDARHDGRRPDLAQHGGASLSVGTNQASARMGANRSPTRSRAHCAASRSPWRDLGLAEPAAAGDRPRGSQPGAAAAVVLRERPSPSRQREPVGRQPDAVEPGGRVDDRGIAALADVGERSPRSRPSGPARRSPPSTGARSRARSSSRGGPPNGERQDLHGLAERTRRGRPAA